MNSASLPQCNEIAIVLIRESQTVLDHITGRKDVVIASNKSLLAGEVAATPAWARMGAHNAETVTSRGAALIK